MIPYRSLAGASLICFFALTGPASAGWVIDQAAKGDREGHKHQTMLQANQMKWVVLDSDGKPLSASIMDLNAETFTHVNYREQSYITSTVQEYVETIQGAMKKASGAMEEAMKKVPPEQRKKMEEMMSSRMSPGSAACPEPKKYEFRKTGQQDTIAGYKAAGYEMVVDGKPKSEFWIAKDITAWKELDPKKLERFMTDLTKTVSRCGPGQRGQAGLGRDQAWKLAGEGYPVRTVDREGQTKTEVVKAESRSIPASEFQPPANFTKKTLSDMMKHER